MLFNSIIFVFIFLPVVLVIYYGLHKLGAHVLAKISLIVASFVFYGYNHPKYLLILLLSILGNFVAYRIIGNSNRNSVRLVIATVAVLSNIFVLFYFKYFDFFITNSNRFLHTSWTTKHILLPLGISFFTFQQVSFIVDAYRGETDDYSLVDYALFVSFFPQLVAGPIVLHNQLISQFKDETRYTIDTNRFAEGIRYMAIGLFKKTMMADAFGRVVDLGYAGEIAWDSPSALLIILAYTLQIYFDFSGYSDMAIGLGKMLGVELPKNFDMPYKACDISDFWKRWHMTMTNFFTKYVYYPLGGNRKGKLRTYMNTMIVFGISGLWHGAGWSFVEWGLLHGAALCLHRMFARLIKKIPKIITSAVTFIFVNCAWVLFRAEGIYQAKQIFRYLFFGGISDTLLMLCNAYAGKNIETLLRFMPVDVTNISCVGSYIITAFGFILSFVFIWFMPSSHELACKRKIKKWEGPFYAVMALMSIMTFMNVNSFLYFNF